MPSQVRPPRWFWATLLLSSTSIVASVFAAWELVENRFFRETDYLTLHYLYITRGVASSLLLACWAAWYVLRQRRRSEEDLRRSREHYRLLLEASPGAVALYDAALRVSEWNAAAERLYGFSKSAVLGRPLPTVPPEKDDELRAFRREVDAGRPVLDAETLRRDSRGSTFDVQLSLLPFREPSGRADYLEVTTDARERVRLRQTLLEIEKLTTMGKMAAGTAHHLNTPLAAMLLRVQMMRERAGGAQAADLARLEEGLLFCQHFVRRLLEFGRRPSASKHPQEMIRTLESVLAFLAPTLQARRARVTLEAVAARGAHVLADANQLEALFSILLANALDAVPDGGWIQVSCRRTAPERLEVRIADCGPGLPASDLPRVFEPFFSTKGPGKGTGLGLPIARHIVHEHGGAIRLENAPGAGALAIVELPVCHDGAPAALAGGPATTPVGVEA